MARLFVAVWPPPGYVDDRVRLGGQWLGAPVHGLDELAAVVFEATEELVPVTHPQPFQADVVLARGRVPAELAGRPWAAGEDRVREPADDRQPAAGQITVEAVAAVEDHKPVGRELGPHGLAGRALEGAAGGGDGAECQVADWQDGRDGASSCRRTTRWRLP